ncbi:heavy metal-associated domain-containing protein [Sphingopyxis sp.]|uniref:heavy-metal-associated domain-containing protein n=1 Tax=Sphingopyxis sp. TaxID=1908224 RepID=UPI0026048133|nr:heavy metal-associated domain-containing protein [Sphingopyxis sp.]MCW0198595.1 heavy-metal-associated domain-containing protein [Sphingopyxis sp.]
MKKLLIVGALAAFAGIGATAMLVPLQPAAQAQAQRSEAQARTASFAIDKMTCATCPITVRTAMSRVDGVRSVKVDFDAKRATVTYDPARATPEAIAAASTNAGYPARLIAKPAS